MENWKPNAIIGVERVFGTVTSPIYVQTNAGAGVLKLPIGCGSTDKLVCEFVGSSLAKWLGVQTPDFALIRTDRNFVEMMLGHDEDLAEVAYGFISRYEHSFPFTPQSIDDIQNKDFFTRIIFLDTWIRNPDRYCCRTGKSFSRNADNLFLVDDGRTKEPYTIKAIDHAEAFRDFSPTFELDEHFGNNVIDDETIYGNFPEFQSHLDWDVACQVADRLSRIETSEIRDLFKCLPKTWILDAKIKKAFISFIVKRADFLSTTLVKKLFPTQKTLF